MKVSHCNFEVHLQRLPYRCSEGFSVLWYKMNGRRLLSYTLSTCFSGCLIQGKTHNHSLTATRVTMHSVVKTTNFVFAVHVHVQITHQGTVQYMSGVVQQGVHILLQTTPCNMAAFSCGVANSNKMPWIFDS